MKLFYSDYKQFQFECTVAERAIPSNAGFTWSDERRAFVAPTIATADKLQQYATEPTRKLLDQRMIRTYPQYKPNEIAHPPELTPRPYQLDDAVFTLSRNRSYLAHDPGLGKTIIAILAHNTEPRPIIYLCPAFLCLTVQREFEKWGTAFYESEIANSGTRLFDTSIYNIVPDSVLLNSVIVEAIRKFAIENDAILFVDEAHRYKAITAKRTQAIFKRVVPQFSRVVFLSGTPMPNRVSELFLPLSRLAPETIEFKDFHNFGRRYCGGNQVNGHWDYSGHSNTAELAMNMKLFMRKRTTDEVLTDLPPLTMQAVYLPSLLPKHLEEIEQDILDSTDCIATTIEEIIAKEKGVDALQVSTYRKELGMAKVKETVAYIKDILETTNESILLFAIHRDVIKELHKELHKYRPSVLVGSTTHSMRDAMVGAFQAGNTRLFIGNIQACGVGFTLTKASRVILSEFSWVPGENIQAIKRAHRIGQRSHVLAQYLLYKGALDDQIYHSGLAKQAVIDAVQEGIESS